MPLSTKKEWYTLSNFTDWLTVIFTGASAATPFLLYKLQLKSNLPLVEGKAVRNPYYRHKGDIKVTLQFTNKIQETLYISDIEFINPCGPTISPVIYRERGDGKIVEAISIDKVRKYDLSYQIPKANDANFDHKPESRIEFYAFDIDPDLESIKLSFRISSSARTLKKRRFVIPINITHEENILAD